MTPDSSVVSAEAGGQATLPLGLYVHIPWCVRKCPYCDFNSHAVGEPLQEKRYTEALLADLEQEARWVAGREIDTLFIGGGTPSLFSGEAVARLLEGVRGRVSLAANAEVTLEANPGTADAGRFSAYREAGVNRLSLGVQSFHAAHLRRLGRIHGPAQARTAFELARAGGFDNINLDLMFGLPGQTSDQALQDLRHAIELAPEHLSWYQLTIEPNTWFHARPPRLPPDEQIWEMQEQGMALLEEKGYRRYEISAYAREGRRCRHNLNYWRFGDYLGVGAGAHGKLTGENIVRRWKIRHPEAYQLDSGAGARAGERILGREELVLEFMMNALRLVEGVSLEHFERFTRLPAEMLEEPLAEARSRGLMAEDENRLQPTQRGLDFLNELLLIFDHGS